MKISQNLKLIREKVGMSQYELSKCSGLSNSTILRLETGEMNNPSIKTLLAICEVLQIKINELVY